MIFYLLFKLIVMSLFTIAGPAAIVIMGFEASPTWGIIACIYDALILGCFLTLNEDIIKGGCALWVIAGVITFIVFTVKNGVVFY